MRGRPPKGDGRLRLTASRRASRRTDPRYHSPQWRRLTKRVIAESGGRCYYRDCMKLASCTDHINPVTPTTLDWEFFDRGNLRASCFWHNVARHVLERGLGADSGAQTHRSRAYGGGRPGVSVGPFFIGRPAQDRNYPVLPPQTPLPPPLTGDYSRQEPEHAAG